MSVKHPPPSVIAQFKPFNSFSEQQCILAASQGEIVEYEANTVFLEIGSHDNLEYFLIRGEVELESIDGRIKKFNDESENAKTALAALVPRKYNVRTLSKCLFFVIKQQVVHALLEDQPKNDFVEFSVAQIHSGNDADDILHAFEDDLKNKRLQLPSFPEVAVHIRQLMQDPHITVKDISDVLANEPAMTVKLIKTCNSPIYRTASQITSCHEAIVRLGFETTKQLVTIFSLREVFKTNNPKLKNKISTLWSHSTEVAAIAHVLAAITPGMKPEFAMLAGLIQDIGSVPVLNYLERYPHIIKIEQRIDAMIEGMKQRVGATMLESWGFHTDLVNVARQSQQWQYQSNGNKAEYADVCIVAQLHTFIGKQQDHKLPRFDQVPAFGKLGKNGLTPEESGATLLKSKREIADLRALLNPQPVPLLRQ